MSDMYLFLLRKGNVIIMLCAYPIHRTNCLIVRFS